MSRLCCKCGTRVRRLHRARRAGGSGPAMKSVVRNGAIAVLSVWLLSAAGTMARAEDTPQAAADIGAAISGGELGFEFRYRLEHVDEDAFDEEALASTLKSRINYKSLDFNRSHVMLEVDNVLYLGDEEFNNFRNNNTRYPVVADPDGTHVNQAYLNVDTGRGHLRLGRQRINLDNQRFIGGVAWRQNEQAFDALTIQLTPTDRTRVSYSYALNVSRIFGPDHGTPPDNYESNSHFLNLGFNPSDATSLSTYAYAMDLKDADSQSNLTVGARLEHAFNTATLRIPLNLEYAWQQDHGDNPVSYDAAYYLVELGFDVEHWKLRAGHEVFEGDRNRPGQMFRTPLATLHKFQGWSDKFLAIPQAGVADTYLSLQYRSLQVTWHDFDSEAGSANLGREWNLSWNYQFNRHYGVLLKFADYEADALATDTRKAWLTFTAKF